MSIVAKEATSGTTIRSRFAILKILLVEDNPGDVRLIREMLSGRSKNVQFNIEPVDSLALGLEKVRKDRYDAVLLDLGLPDSTGLQTFYSFHSAAPNVPIIVLTVLHGEDAAVDAVRDGAQDYLIKGRIESDLLTRGILYSIERKHSEGVLRLRTIEAEYSQVRAETYFDFLAHDIANIISPIMAYAELISDDASTSAGVKKRAEKIVEQSRRAASFILSLRGLEEVERTPLDRFETINLLDIFPIAEELVRREYPEKRLTVEYDLPPGVSLRVIGGKYIQSILEGILENAASYADSVALSVNIKVAPFDAPGGRTCWQVEISDYGPGMPDDIKSCFRVSPNPSEGYRKGVSRGVASSLLIYSTVVKRFGGRIWIEDRVSGDFTKGARILMRLPGGG